MASLYKTSTGRMFHAGAICLVPVGLPARGKTFMSRKLSRYLRWLGVKTQVFNVGAYRRTLYGTGVDQSFFDLKDAESFSKREHVADKALEDMMQFFQSGGQVGIYDTTMTIMQSRRQKLVERCAKENVQVVFIETICDRQEVIEANIREVKLTAPEYVGWELEEAVKDFLMRIDHHVPFYDALNDPSLSYIKVINLGIDSNVGEHIVVNNVKGYLQTRLVYYLMNLHIARRTIYFLQNGESTSDNTFKDDAPLSEQGVKYSQYATDLITDIRQKQGNSSPLRVLTSCRRRSSQTAQYFQPPVEVETVVNLAELNPGAVEAMTEQQIKEKYPEDYLRHQKDPYNHRYPRGESYHDLALRLEDVILELEREKDDVLIIAHETVLRCLYAYLLDRPEEEIPAIHIPKNTLIEFIPMAYGGEERRHKFEIN